jgi:L-lactate dehydrogenase
MPSKKPEPKYDYLALEKFARALLVKTGLGAAMARDVAEILVEGDLLGKTTHGLALLAPYLQNIADGKMTTLGRPKILRKSAAALLLDGNYLPGPFVLRRALDWAVPQAKKHGVATVSIRRCHHLACLQAYLPSVTERGLAVVLMCSDPANATVAAPGGIAGVCSPNPIAAGFPARRGAVLIDTTTSSAANGPVARMHQEKRKFPVACLQTAQGRPTNNPAVLFEQPPGSILPLGGIELGHKGFALAMLVEALTSALAGHGRADRPGRWGASVFLQVLDPEFFGGTVAFRKETEFFAQLCRKSKARPGAGAVRLPGEKSMARRREQRAGGVTLHSQIRPSLEKWMQKYGVEFPYPRKSSAL